MSSIVPYVAATGVQQVEAAYYTLTNGVLASQILLRILPQSSPIPLQMHVTFVGGFTSIPLRQCIVDFGSLKRNLSSQVVSLRVWDRRHLWKYAGEVNGRFNVHLPDGSLLNQKGLRDLAVMLLTLAGETNFSANVLPNNVYPEVEWEYKKPMFALEQLMADNGYEVCWNPITDQVHIEEDGFGADLPATSDTSGSSLDVNLSTVPAQIAVVCAPVQVQAKLKLRAVVPEANGTVSPINSASYVPASGWFYQQGSNFEDVAVEHGDAAAALAREGFGKWFQLEAFADGSFNCPGYPENPLPDILSISPLSWHLAETYAPVGSIRKVPKSAYVQGVFLAGNNDGGIAPVENTQSRERVDVPFDMDRHQMIVKFSEPVLKRDGSQLVPADLWLTASFEITNAVSQLKERHVYRLSLGGAVGSHIDSQEDIQRQVIAVYANDDPNQSATVTDNEVSVNAEAHAKAVRASNQFLSRIGRVRIYRDFQPIVTDGAIKQVMWMQNLRDGADTMAGRHTQFDAGSLRRIERRRILEESLFREDRKRRLVRRRRERDEGR
jgi:hypothetical protein